MARLSVIIPAFEEEVGIFSAVQAIQLALSPFEVIVVDDGSSDRTGAEAARAGARVIGQSNQGHGAALICGANAAEGDWLLLLDADDEIDLSSAAEHFALACASGLPLFGQREGRAQTLPRRMMTLGLALLAGQRDANAPYKFISHADWLWARRQMRPDVELPSLALSLLFPKALRRSVAVKKARKERLSLARLGALSFAALREMRDYS